MEVVGDSRFLTGPAALPDPSALSPLFRHLSLTVPPASIEETYSDWLRLARGLERAACPPPITAGLGMLQGWPRHCGSRTAGSWSAWRKARRAAG